MILESVNMQIFLLCNAYGLDFRYTSQQSCGTEDMFGAGYAHAMFPYLERLLAVQSLGNVCGGKDETRKKEDEDKGRG